MSQKEVYGNRDGEMAYSAFHRVASARRWISYEDAVRLANVNIDRSLWIECHHRSFEPFALIETAIDIKQTRKPMTATRNLARRAGVWAYLVLYTLGDRVDPVTGETEIVKLRRICVWPDLKPAAQFMEMTPKEYFEGLIRLRKSGVKAIVAAARSGDGQRRNHDAPRLLRKIEAVPAQMDMWL